MKRISVVEEGAMKWLRIGVIPAIALFVNGGLAAQDAGGAGETQLHQVWATPSAYTADTGASVPAFSQSPTLDAAVASGDLPPVEDRLPGEPLVVLGVDGPGLYGGTLFGATYDVGLATAMRDETSLILNKHSFTADPYPNVAKSYEAIDDRSAVWEVKLREGLLWSDGTPFTSADITFWWDDMILNTDITPQLRPQYRGVAITAIDDYT
ncbi:MAG: ABC transporter substrate-binding protein, partial [Chloroflexota bacterium]|nr:ABC transporter substrate-binding protein [Chloroflexota bacterium]